MNKTTQIISEKFRGTCTAFVQFAINQRRMKSQALTGKGRRVLLLSESQPQGVPGTSKLSHIRYVIGILHSGTNNNE